MDFKITADLRSHSKPFWTGVLTLKKRSTEEICLWKTAEDFTWSLWNGIIVSWSERWRRSMLVVEFVSKLCELKPQACESMIHFIPYRYCTVEHVYKHIYTTNLSDCIMTVLYCFYTLHVSNEAMWTSGESHEDKTSENLPINYCLQNNLITRM